MSIIDAEMEIHADPIKSIYIGGYFSFFFSFLFAIFGITIKALQQKYQIVEKPVEEALFYCLIFLCVLPNFMRMVKKDTYKVIKSKSKFLQISANRFKNLYSDDLNVGSKLVELCDGSLLSKPIKAEDVYDKKPYKTKYHKYAYYIEINQNGSNFQYVWYTNINYSKINDDIKNRFLKCCKEQIGVNWKSVKIPELKFEKIQDFSTQ